MFETELNFFIANQMDFVKKYPNEFLLIVSDKLIDVFSTPLEAYEAAQEKFEKGTFLIQPCISGPAAYTVELNGGP